LQATVAAEVVPATGRLDGAGSLASPRLEAVVESPTDYFSPQVRY
jgi:hypothetical protein